LWADSYNVETNGDQQLKKLIGNVVLQQADVVIHCNTAVQYLTENRAQLIGNVVITQEDLVLESPKIDYDGHTGIAKSFENVSIKDKNAHLTANNGTYNTKTFMADFFDKVHISDDTVNIDSRRLLYNRKSRESWATGNVRIEDDSMLVFADSVYYQRETRDVAAFANVQTKGKYRSLYLTCDTLRHTGRPNYSIATGEPALFRIDSAMMGRIEVDSNDPVFHNKKNKLSLFKRDTMSITSKVMEARKGYDYETYTFTDSVQVCRNNLFVKAGFGEYHKTEDYINLIGKPVLWNDSTMMTGDSIVIFLTGNSLSYIQAIKNSFAAMRQDTADPARIDQMSADYIMIHFVDDSISDIDSWGNAKSLYFGVSGGEGSGADRSAEDTIKIFFVGGQIDRAVLLGEVHGNYYPDKQLKTNVKDYYLPSFQWSDDKPKKRVLRWGR
jgi:lipopolysaccharide export system protein LptA